MSYRVAVLGATGLVGQEMLSTLESRHFPVSELRPLASERSAGETIEFHGEEIDVQVATPEAFAGIDIVLSSAGGEVSKKLLPAAAKHGAVSIDNTSAFRMEKDVPLVVPEVNPEQIKAYDRKRRIIANPNCSTIQMVVALKPLDDIATIKRVIVSTYQSVSGGGKRALDDLFEETRAIYTQENYERQVYAKQIAFNVLPQIDVFLDHGDTKEEWKMQHETPKIMGKPIAVHATCVRVPVFYGHSEAVWIETQKPLSPDEAKNILANAPGIIVLDDPKKIKYPTPAEIAGEDAVYVGRIRQDPTIKNGLAFWIVSDNIRKGAALNAVQIAEGLDAYWQKEGKV